MKKRTVEPGSTERPLSERVAHGAFWMVLMQVIDRLLGVASMIVLARLLVPGDFGLVAMAMSIVALAELLGAFGFDMALIQNRNAQREDFDSAWTLNILLGLACGGILTTLAFPASRFYEEPRLVSMIVVLALAPVLGGFANIGTVAFRKEFKFRSEFVYLLTRRVMGFVTTICLALLLKNYWALVFGTVAGRAFGLVLSYMFHPYRPRVALGAARAILGFSGWLVVNHILGFAFHRGAHFVVGKTLGSAALGLHTIAYDIANIPREYMIAPVNRAVYPAYAAISGDKASLARAYLRVLGMTAAIALPAGLGIAAISDVLVGVALGERWLAAAPLLGILAVSSAIGATQTNMVYVYNALGRPHRQTLVMLAYVVVLVPCMLVGVDRWQLEGVALAYLVTGLLHAPLTFTMMARELAFGWRDYARVLLRPSLSAVLMFAVLKPWLRFDPAAGFWPGMAILAGGAALGVALYVSSMLALWALAGRPAGAEREFLDLALRLLRKRAGGPS